MLPSIEARLSVEVAAKPAQIAAAIALLDEGATVPFIARYRKEITGGLDDIQLRLLDERLRYLRELEERRATFRLRCGAFAVALRPAALASSPLAQLERQKPRRVSP